MRPPPFISSVDVSSTCVASPGLVWFETLVFAKKKSFHFLPLSPLHDDAPPMGLTRGVSGSYAKQPSRGLCTFSPGVLVIGILVVWILGNTALSRVLHTSPLPPAKQQQSDDGSLQVSIAQISKDISSLREEMSALRAALMPDPVGSTLRAESERLRSWNDRIQAAAKANSTHPGIHFAFTSNGNR